MIIRTFRLSDVNALVDMYCTCFAEGPWYEQFEREEVAREFLDMQAWKDTCFLVAEQDDRVLGAAIGYAFDRRIDMRESIPTNASKVFYVAEIFVDPSVRGQRIATRLVDALLSEARKAGYSHGVVRTSENQPIIIGLFQRRGFRIIAHQEVISLKVINNKEVEAPDTRVVLYGTL